MKHCYALARFQMKIPPGVEGVRGGLISPSGLAYHTLARRDLDTRYPHLRRRLLDPQMYLAGLNPTRCAQTCVNLSSYPWFGVEGLSQYDSGASSQSEWARLARQRVADLWRGLPSDSAELERAVQTL